MNLSSHSWSDCNHDIIVNPDLFPYLQVGDVVCVYHPSPSLAQQQYHHAHAQQSLQDQQQQQQQQQQASLQQQQQMQQQQMIFQQQQQQYLNQQQQGSGQRSGDDADNESKYRLILVITTMNKMRGRYQVSICNEIMNSSLFQLRKYQPIIVEKVSRDIKAVAVSGSYQQRHQQQASLREIFIPAFARSGYVEFFFKDAFVSQSRFWRFRRALRGQAVYIGKTISFGGVNFRVDDILSEQNSQSTLSGVVTETTKLIFRSGSARIYWLIQISKEMWDFIEEDGDLFHERLINKFLPEVIDRWTRKNVKHMLTVVFFSRTFFDKVPESYSNTSSSGNIFHRDYNDRYYVDFYRVALQNVDFSSHPGGWRAIIPILKKEISMFPAYCGWDFGSPWMKNPEGNENVVNGMNNPATIAPGISGPDAPKGIASSAQEGNVLEAINLALNILDKHYIDRELSITGQAVVLITPGPGVFEVDRDLTNITKLRMMDNSIGCDVVSLAKAPLHVAPLFIFKPRYPLPEGDKPDLLDQPHPFAPRSTYFLDSDLVDIPSEGSKNLSDYPKRSSKQEVNQRKPVYNVPYWIHLSFPYVKPAKRRNVTEIVLPRPPLTPGFYAPSSRIAVKYIESSLVLQAEMRNFGTNPDKTTIWRERFESLPEHQFACKLILSSDDYIRVTSEPVIPHIASLTLSSSGQNLSSSFSTHSLPIESQTSQQTNNSNNTNQTNVSSSNSNTTNNNNNINGNNNNSAVAVVKEEKKKNLTFAVKNASKASLSAPLSKSRTSMMNLRSINQSSSKLGSGFIQDSYLHSNSHVNVSHQVSMEMHEIMKDANLIRDEQLYHDKRVFSSQTSYMASPSRQYMERPEGETATLLNLPQSAIGMGNQSTIQDVTASPRRLSFSTSHSDMRHEKQLASKALQGLDQQSLTRISSLSSSIRINSTEPQSVSHSRMQPQPSSSYSETPSALKILHARSKASGNDFTLGTLSDGEKEGEHELNMNQLSSDEESSTKHLPFKPVNLDKGAHYMNRSVSTANIESSTRFHQEKEPNSFPVPENIKSNPHSFHTSPSAKNDDPNTYINPFNSKKIQSDLNRLSYNRSRWAHLFPQGKFQDRNDGKDPVGEVIPITIESYRPNWKSLTSPGIVPLTTEFEPQEADLKRDYTEKVYSLVPPKGCTEQQALNEIVELRFAQDFQLIVRPKPAPIYHEQQTSTQIATNNQAISINGTAATNPSFIHQTQTSQTPSSTSFENTSNVLKRFQPRPTQSLQGIEPVKSMERKISTSVNHPNKGIIGSKGTGTKSLKSDGDLATYELTMGHTIHCISHSDGHIYVKSFVQKNSKSKFRSSDWNYSYLLWDSLLNVAAPVHHSHKPNLINYKWNSLDNAIIEAQNFEDKGPYQVPYRRQNYSIIPIQLPLNLSLNDLAPSNTNLSNPNQDNVDGLRTEQEKKMFNGFLSFVKWISTRLQSTNSLTVKQYAKMLQLDVLKDGGKSNDEDDNNFVLVKVALVASKREAHAHHGEGAKKDGANEQKKDESKDAVNKEEGSNLGDKTVTSGSNDRTEWLILRLDKVFSPYKCFHMEVQWMLASGIRVAEFVSQMINFTQKFGLSLKQTPEYCRSLTPGYNEHGAGRIPHPFVIPRSLTDATNPMLSDNRFHALLVGMLLREEAGFLIDDVIAKKNVPVSPSSLISPTVAVSGVTNGSLTMTAPIASTTNPVLRRSRSQQIESKDEVKEWQQLRVSTMVHRDGIAFISLNEGITFVPNYRVLTPTKQSEEEQKIRSLLFQAINYVAIAEATFEFVDSIFSSAGLN